MEPRAAHPIPPFHLSTREANSRDLLLYLLNPFPPLPLHCPHPPSAPSSARSSRPCAILSLRHTLNMEKDGRDVESGTPTKIGWFKMVYDQGVVTPEIINHHYPGSGTEEDPYIINWLENDPRNPMAFEQSTKWLLTALVAIATLAVAFVSSAFSGGVKQIIEQFDITQEVVTLGISLFVLGFAIGPLMWAPMSGETSRWSRIADGHS